MEGSAGNASQIVCWSDTIPLSACSELFRQVVVELETLQFQTLAAHQCVDHDGLETVRAQLEWIPKHLPMDHFDSFVAREFSIMHCKLWQIHVILRHEDFLLQIKDNH